MPAPRRTKAEEPYIAKVPPAAQARQQQKEPTPETKTMHPHQKDDNRSTARRQDAPDRQKPRAHTSDPTSSPAEQVRQQGKEPTPEIGTTHPHPKDEDRNTAPRQDAPGRKTSKARRTPQGPQDQEAQVRQQEKKPIPETGKTHPHQKNENRDAAPRQDTGPPSDPDTAGAHPPEPTSSPAQARQQGGRPT